MSSVGFGSRGSYIRNYRGSARKSTIIVPGSHNDISGRNQARVGVGSASLMPPPANVQQQQQQQQQQQHMRRSQQYSQNPTQPSLGSLSSSNLHRGFMAPAPAPALAAAAAFTSAAASAAAAAAAAATAVDADSESDDDEETEPLDLSQTQEIPSSSTASSPSGGAAAAATNTSATAAAAAAAAATAASTKKISDAATEKAKKHQLQISLYTDTAKVFYQGCKTVDQTAPAVEKLSTDSAKTKIDNSNFYLQLRSWTKGMLDASKTAEFMDSPATPMLV